LTFSPLVPRAGGSRADRRRPLGRREQELVPALLGPARAPCWSRGPPTLRVWNRQLAPGIRSGTRGPRSAGVVERSAHHDVVRVTRPRACDRTRGSLMWGDVVGRPRQEVVQQDHLRKPRARRSRTGGKPMKPAPPVTTLAPGSSLSRPGRACARWIVLESEPPLLSGSWGWCGGEVAASKISLRRSRGAPEPVPRFRYLNSFPHVHFGEQGHPVGPRAAS